MSGAAASADAAPEALVGVVADNHGHLCEETLAALAGADAILHAGDVGSEALLDRLRGLAPVVAVVGNGDPDLTHRYPWEQRVELAGFRILLCHWYDNFGTLHPRVLRELDAWRPHVLVHGHTHRAELVRRDGTLFLNPGYAGEPGGGRRRSVARLRLGPAGAVGEIVPLRAEGPATPPRGR